MSALPIRVANVHRAPVRQADTDQELIRLWLHGRSIHTQRAYNIALGKLRAFAGGVGLSEIRLTDLQAFGDELAGSGLAVGSQILMLAAVKSLFGFAHRLGYLQFDTGRAMRLPKKKDTLAERILTEAQVHKMLAVESTPRNAALILFLYATGARVSEAAGVRWKDFKERGEGAGQVTLFGKGSKTRTVLLPASVWAQLMRFRGDAGDDAPAFLNRQGRALSGHQLTRIVHTAARLARLKASPSAHWMRHSHATHAIERGAPLNLVSSTLGHASLAVTGRYLHCRPSESSSKWLAL